MRDPPRRRAALAAACSLVLVLAGCGDGGGDEAGGKTLTVYVSAPLRGPDAAHGRAIISGARLALGEAGGKVGDLRVRARYLDGAGRAGRWNAVVTAANARRATEDTSTIAYIGDFASGATRFSLPITNQAEILQVSPAAGAGDLTRDVPGGEDPDRLRPTGEQTFARLVPADDVQAEAAAAWALDIGVDRIPPIEEVNLDLASDGQRATSAVFGWPTGGADPNVAAPPGAGREAQRFADEYLQRYARVPDPYAAQGYEAMAVVLDSIRRAGEGGDRRADVIEAFFETRSRRSPIGAYSVEPSGDTTLDAIAGLRIRDGRAFLETELRG